MNTILIADDEKKIRDTISDYLKFKGMEIILAANGEEAVANAYEHAVDLIILDVMMPKMNGIEACKEIRKFSKVPILFLSALGEEEDLLSGYLAGGDDYIVKPFPLSVLAQKIQSILNRLYGVHDDHFLEAAGIRIDTSAMKVYDAGKEIDINGKDFELLLYLMQNKGRIVSREMILSKVWGYDYDGDLRVVDTRIKRIRKALGEKASLIQTKINYGYRFDDKG